MPPRKAIQNEKQMEMALITRELLKRMTEATLLEYAQVLYRINYPKEKAVYAFADAIGKTTAHINQAVAGECCIGTIAWLKIQDLLPAPIFDIWYEEQRALTYIKSEK